METLLQFCCLALFFEMTMTRRKIAGCVLGFAGVVVINLLGNSLDMGFKLIGEGFVLIAQLSYGISTVLINLFSRKVSPVVLSGTQFTMGGIVLMLIGAGMGGHLGKCYYRGCGNYILSGNGFGSGIYALVRTACLERCFQSGYLWICEPALWRDFISTDTWRGETGI